VHELLRTYNVSSMLRLQANMLDQSSRILEENLKIAEQAHAQFPGDMRIERELARTEDGLATIEIMHGLPHIATTRIERAIESLEMSFDYRGLVHAQITLAEAEIQAGDYEHALESASRALRTASALQGDILTVSAQVVFANASILMGHLDEGWQILEKVSEIGGPYRRVDLKARSHLIRATVFRQLEEFGKSGDECYAVLSLKTSPALTAEAMIGYGSGLRLTNRREEGNVYLKEALELTRRYDLAPQQILGEMLYALDIGYQGDYDQACQKLNILAERANQRGLKQMVAMLYYYFGFFSLIKGNASTARRMALQITGTDSIPGPWMVISGLLLLNQVNRHDGQIDAVLERRMVQTLDHLRSKTSMEPLKTYVERYIQKKLNELADR
jgi:tetratricopeptide (TPR) repeat protein